MDKLYGHQVSSDEDLSDEDGQFTNRSNHQSGDELVPNFNEQALNSSRVVFAIESTLDSDGSEGAGVIGTTTATASSSDVSVDSVQYPFYTQPALRSARGPGRIESEQTDVRRISALERARRTSSTSIRNSLPFVSIYVDELPMGAYIALFYQRHNMNISLNKKSKTFFAVEVYSARLNSDDLEHYDERMAKVPHAAMVYDVNVITMEQLNIKRVDADDTVDAWFEMSSSDQGIYIRVAATYTLHRSHIKMSLVGVECRPMHDVDVVIAYRSFGQTTARQQKLPSIFFTPQLFENDAPIIIRCIPSPKRNKIAIALWDALRDQASTDWSNYVETRESFVQDYSTLVDRASKVESVSSC